MKRYRKSPDHVRAVLVLIFVCLAWSAVASAAEATDYLRSARDYLGKGQAKAAVIELKNALQREPNNGAARLLLGTTYLKLGNGASAEKELRQARKLGFDRSRWLIPLGKSYLLQRHSKQVLDEVRAQDGDTPELRAEILALRVRAHLNLRQLDQARADLKQSLELAPDNLETLLAAARLALVQKNYDDATRHLDKAIRLAPRSAPAWLLRAETYRLGSKPREALKAFSKVVEINPDHLGARLGKATMLVALGKDQAAGKELDTVARTAPDAPLLQYLRAVLAFKNKDFAASQAALQSLLSKVPGHLPAHLLLGTVEYALGQYQSAETHLGRYLAAFPTQLPAAKLLAATRLRLKNPDGAIAVLTPLEKQAPKDAQLLALLGTAYMLKQDYERGTQYLEKAAAIAPDAAAIRMQIGLGRLAMGQTKQGVADLETAVDMGKGPVQADILLVLVHLRQKEFDQALAAARAMAGKSPRNPVPENLISAAYLGKGDRAAARKHLEKALAIDPHFSTARINLARMDESDNDLDGARRRYRRVLKDKPGDLRALLGLARLAERGGKLEKAVELVKRARDANPGALEPGLILARYYLRRNEPLQALSVARQLFDRHPRRPAVLTMLGAAQLAAGEQANAVNTFRKLVKLQPAVVGYRLMLAEAYFKRQYYKQARASLLQALKIKHDHLPSLLMLAGLDLKEYRVDQAREIALKIQRLYPKSGAGFRLQGDIARRAGNFTQAAPAYQQAYTRTPNGRVAVLLAQSRARSGDAKGAIEALKAWLKRQPGDAAVRLVLASMYERKAMRADAIREYERVKDKYPDNPVVWNNLALLYHERGDRRGIEYAEKAHELAPKRPEITDTLGWILVNEGKPQRGLVLLQDAAVHAPHIPQIRYHLAVALSKTGRRDEARKELERLLRSGRQFPEADKARALLKRLRAD